MVNIWTRNGRGKVSLVNIWTRNGKGKQTFESEVAPQRHIIH